MTAHLTLKVTALIDADGFHQTPPNCVCVYVAGGLVADIDNVELTYILQNDGWLRDWAGRELQLSTKSLERLKTAISNN